MDLKEKITNLDFWANISAIGTAAVGIFAYGRYLYNLRQKQLKLEAYLQSEKKKDLNQQRGGQHNIVHLMAELGLTREEILQASFRSKKVIRLPIPDNTKRAVDIFFKYR